MAAGRLAFQFSANLVRLDHGLGFHILPVPEPIAAAWKRARVRRLVGTINGQPVKRALLGHADGGSYFIVGRDLQKQAGITPRSAAVVAFKPDPAPDQLDLPGEFQLVLSQDTAARSRWNTFTPGLRRSLLSYITSAKTEETRIRRSVTLARKIRTHALHRDLHPPSLKPSVRRRRSGP